MSREGFFEDKDAERAIQQIDYDFSKPRIQTKTQIMLSVRTKPTDNFTQEYLKIHPDSTVLYLSYGLDARAGRLSFSAKMWYDLDFPDVIEIKRQRYERTEHYQYIASSVTNWSWMNDIEHHAPVLIIAEGLLMYLKELDAQELILRLRDKFGHAAIIFDAYSQLTATQAKRHPSLKGANAFVQWGVDTPRQIEAFGEEIRHVKTLYLTDEKEIAHLPRRSYRFMFRMAEVFKTAREAHRIFVITLRKE